MVGGVIVKTVEVVTSFTVDCSIVGVKLLFAVKSLVVGGDVVN